MENNGNGGNNGESFINKAIRFLQKMYHFRLRVDRKGQPIVNVSSIFGALCLIFAPHMTVVGIVASLLLGYQIRFESEDDDGAFGEQVRKAAGNIKAGAASAAKSIQREIEKARANSASGGTAPAARGAEPVQAAPKAAEPVQAVPKAAEPIPSNDELLKDLQDHAEENVNSNPAATTFHSAYAASAGSVPVLRVQEETEDTQAPARAAQNRE